MRSLGMTPILPAFQGFVPIAMMSKFPGADIKRDGKPPLCADGTAGARWGCPAEIDAVYGNFDI